MTNPTTDPNDREDDARDDEGKASFILGPQDHVDGTPVEFTPEVIRRLKADMHLAAEFARKHGLDLKDIVETDSANAADSERSKEITRAANPEMAEAGLRFRRTHQSLEVEQPDGTKVNATKTDTEIEARAVLEGVVKAVVSLKEGVCWSGRVVIRCGKWIAVKVSASTGESEQEV